MSLSRFHPIIAEWFYRQIGQPTDVQVQAWPAIYRKTSSSHWLKSGTQRCDGAVVRAVLGREAVDRPNEQIKWSGRANR